MFPVLRQERIDFWRKSQLVLLCHSSLRMLTCHLVSPVPCLIDHYLYPCSTSLHPCAYSGSSHKWVLWWSGAMCRTPQVVGTTRQSAEARLRAGQLKVLNPLGMAWETCLACYLKNNKNFWIGNIFTWFKNTSKREHCESALLFHIYPPPPQTFSALPQETLWLIVHVLLVFLNAHKR